MTRIIAVPYGRNRQSTMQTPNHSKYKSQIHKTLRNGTRILFTTIVYPEKVRTNTDSTRHRNVYTNRRRDHHMHRGLNELVAPIKETNIIYPFSSTTITNCTCRRSSQQKRRNHGMPTTHTSRTRRHQRIHSK